MPSVVLLQHHALWPNLNSADLARSSSSVVFGGDERRETQMNILTVNLVFSTVVFAIAAKLYLIPMLRRLEPPTVVRPILLLLAPPPRGPAWSRRRSPGRIRWWRSRRRFRRRSPGRVRWWRSHWWLWRWPSRGRWLWPGPFGRRRRGFRARRSGAALCHSRRCRAALCPGARSLPPRTEFRSPPALRAGLRLR